MGLCHRCRNATPTFCYVHRKHVCGDCVEHHPICVCKSYVEWLQNSDYDWPPVCSLCREAVEESAGGGGGGDGFDGPLPVIRLGCFCLFHADCLAAHTDALPETTTPAGYACPDCTMPIVRTKTGAETHLSKKLGSWLAERPWLDRVSSLNNMAAPTSPAGSTGMRSPVSVRTPGNGGRGDRDNALEMHTAAVASALHRQGNLTAMRPASPGSSLGLRATGRGAGHEHVHADGTVHHGEHDHGHGHGSPNGALGRPPTTIDMMGSKSGSGDAENKYGKRTVGQSIVGFLLMIPVVSSLVMWYKHKRATAARGEPCRLCGIRGRSIVLFCLGLGVFLILLVLGFNSRAQLKQRNISIN